QLRQQIARLNFGQSGGTVIAHQVIDKNSRDAWKLRGRVDALLEAQRVLDRYFVFAAGDFIVHFVLRLSRCSLFAVIKLATTAHGAANCYAQAEEYEQHRSDQ